MNKQSIIENVAEIKKASIAVKDIGELLMDINSTLHKDYGQHHNEETKKAIDTLNDAYQLTSMLEEKDLHFITIKREIINLLKDKLIHDPKANHIMDELKKL